jgi:hypothetical protein
MAAGAVVVVNCTHQCNVWVMDDSAYASFTRGAKVRAYGGGYRRLPARIRVPHSGMWNVVLEAPPGARYGMSVVGA